MTFEKQNIKSGIFPDIRRVALITRPYNATLSQSLNAVIQYLQQKKIAVVIEQETHALLDPSIQSILPHCAAKMLHTACDLLIVVGGDGSLLHAAMLAAPQGLPVLGINRGRLGFLTDIYPEELHKMDAVFSGHYQIEERFLLAAQVAPAANFTSHLALNDVVLLSGDSTHMIEFAITVDEEFLCNIRADGLIIATPTGSTAYALSGGGPILHPNLDALVLVPMFPHNLNNRPIVIKGNSHLQLQVTSAPSAAAISCDGRPHTPLAPGQTVSVKRAEPILKLVHPLDYHYFQTLREKLGWQQHRV